MEQMSSLYGPSAERSGVQNMRTEECADSVCYHHPIKKQTNGLINYLGTVVRIFNDNVQLFLMIKDPNS